MQCADACKGHEGICTCGVGVCWGVCVACRCLKGRVGAVSACGVGACEGCMGACECVSVCEGCV